MLPRFVPGVVLLLILAYAGVVKSESYSIENFLNIVPFSDLVQNDEINGSILSELLKKGTGSAAGSANWILEKYGDDIIIVRSKNERWVLRMYPMAGGSRLLLVNIQLGNHRQAQDFIFFTYSEQNGSLSGRMDKFKFLADIKENEFLVKNRRFSSAVEKSAILYMSDDGTIVAEPWVWMESRWENKEPDYRILFKWKKGQFVKIKERL